MAHSEQSINRVEDKVKSLFNCLILEFVNGGVKDYVMLSKFMSVLQEIQLMCTINTWDLTEHFYAEELAHPDTENQKLPGIVLFLRKWYVSSNLWKDIAPTNQVEAANVGDSDSADQDLDGTIFLERKFRTINSINTYLLTHFVLDIQTKQSYKPVLYTIQRLFCTQHIIHRHKTQVHEPLLKLAERIPAMDCQIPYSYVLSLGKSEYNV